MKKLGQILFLSIVFIAPECSAMKMVPKFLKKDVLLRKMTIDVGSHSRKFRYGLAGFCTAYTAINSLCSFSAGHNKFDDAREKRIISFLMSLYVETLVAKIGGQLFVYSVFQGACYGMGCAKRKYEEKKKLEKQKKD